MKYPTRAELVITPGRKHATPADRLARAFAVRPSGCWEWIRSRTTAGYGRLWFRGAYYQAHCLLYILLIGPIPAGLEIDHLCRNRACVNPAHLEPVTHAVNAQRGARTKLNRTDLDLIRASRAAGDSLRTIGRRLGVDHTTVYRALNGDTWGPDQSAAVAA